MSSFSFLLVMVMITYSLIGMELFAFRVAFNSEDILDLDDG
jgi:hypothetical protein